MFLSSCCFADDARTGEQKGRVAGVAACVRAHCLCEEAARRVGASRCLRGGACGAGDPLALVLCKDGFERRPIADIDVVALQKLLSRDFANPFEAFRRAAKTRFGTLQMEI